MTTDRPAAAAAALREQIAREIEAMAVAECSARRDKDNPELAAHFAERGLTFTPHYPDEGWSYCDGCSSAQTADLVIHAIAEKVRRGPEAPVACPRCGTVIPPDADGDPDGVQLVTTGRWYCGEPCLDADQRESSSSAGRWFNVVNGTAHCLGAFGTRAEAETFIATQLIPGADVTIVETEGGPYVG